MSLGYVDSSCIVAIALGEPECEALKESLGRFSILFSSGLLEAEVLSVLRREAVAEIPLDGFSTEIEWVVPEKPLGAEIREALAAGRLRGADLWHVASALYLRRQLGDGLAFVTLDGEQRAVAAELGFSTVV